MDNLWRYPIGAAPCSEPDSIFYHCNQDSPRLSRTLGSICDYDVISTDPHRNFYLPGDIDEEGPCSCLKIHNKILIQL